MSCGDPHEMDCREALIRTQEFIDHELPTADQQRIQQHLDECGPCLAEYGLETAFRNLLRRSCACEPAPPSLRARIIVQITEVRMHLDS